MRAGIGFSDNNDSLLAGAEAARSALDQVGLPRPCDLVLLFHAGRHQAHLLQEAVAGVVGPAARIVGGGGLGVVAGDHYGHNGREVGVAAVWLDGAECEIIADHGLDFGEEAAGRRLGAQLARRNRKSPFLLFYDTSERVGLVRRSISAMPLLEGLAGELGAAPEFYGAGFLGEVICQNGPQWVQDGIIQHQALTLSFSGPLRLDSLVMNGCRPATGYYAVTRAEGREILEIEGRPATAFIAEQLGPSLPMDLWPEFLMLGVNRGELWGDFAEASYSCHICQDVDPSRNSLVMLEPCLAAGDRAQIMYRHTDSAGIAARVDGFLAGLEGRRLCLALYLACAFRLADRGHIGVEDAKIIRDRLRGRVPLLGFYGGMEIAPVANRVLPLNWSGILCLLTAPERTG